VQELYVNPKEREMSQLVQTQVQTFKLKDLVNIEFDLYAQELKARKTKVAKMLESKYPYFKVNIDESKRTLTIFISDTDESVTIIADKYLYDKVFVIDSYVYADEPQYYVIPFDKLGDLAVARIEVDRDGDTTLSVGLIEEEVEELLKK